MIALIRAAVRGDVTHLDTAAASGQFTNEDLVGEALAPLRDEVVIATKFGFDDSRRLLSRSNPARPAVAGQAQDQANATVRRIICLPSRLRYRLPPS
jgi:aryl-alcohol dehydrogenase-like predicted oxidoreductase